MNRPPRARRGPLARTMLALIPCVVLGLSYGARHARGDEPIVFNRDIRPLLTDNCFFCHGPDKEHREADLRLDQRDVAVECEAIVPGHPEDSLLIERIESGDPKLVMPPPHSNKSLTAAQRALLKRWIAEGAEYQGHWAFQAPVKPQAPEGSPAIDFFVSRKLQAAGAELSREADRRTLIRRLTFDLLGLPPSPAEVDAFLADTAADAYGRLVERLLASPQYGERMAQGWLDVARYADTIGYHSDNPRNVWPYRDYVIRSFNDNKPFDRFTVEQLAGDLLPDAGIEQKVASCFNRLLLTTEEGGAQAQDYEARMVADRVRAVGTVWLGLTIGCCQCHDHKFDPPTQRDFYALGAFFADVQEPAIGRREPGMLVPTAEQEQELARRRAEVARLQQEFDRPSPEFNQAFQTWEQQVRQSLTEQDQWKPLHPESIRSEHGVVFKTEADQTIVAESNPTGGSDTYHVEVRDLPAGVTALRLDALPHPSLPAKGPGRAGNGNFVLNELEVWLGDRKLDMKEAGATFSQSNYPVAGAIDGNTERLNGWAVLGHIGQTSSLWVVPRAPITLEAGTSLKLVMVQTYGENHVLGRFRLFATTTEPPPAVTASPYADDVLQIVRVEEAARNDDQKQRLIAAFKESTPLRSELRAQLAAAKKVATDYEEKLPRCLVSVSLSTPKVVRLLPRGNWQDETGPTMQPAWPGFLGEPHRAPSPTPTEDRGANRRTRRDLARWIVSRDNPLTARVFVNRLWRQCFGAGLSTHTDDLGSQGAWPSHPDLLDWLACEFMDSGWDVKHMLRLIVHSRTYRQVSEASAQQLARDPFNRELGRQSRFRLEAELVRDNALAIAGMLSPKIGGPSVKPYQPEGYWENLNFPVRTYEADAGENQYRRGLYTWWQRSFLHPSLLAFDAPSREECAADRNRSNIPQQALVLLNDPTYVEASRVLAARVLHEGGADDQARFRWLWRQALQREPRDPETAALFHLLEQHRGHYAADRAAADALLKVGQAALPADLDHVELAAWTGAVRVILNLHETITRN